MKFFRNYCALRTKIELVIDFQRFFLVRNVGAQCFVLRIAHQNFKEKAVLYELQFATWCAIRLFKLLRTTLRTA
jgi:hypothetical protein